MKVAVSRGELEQATRELPRPLALVPTMGALHDGHLALVDAARSAARSVVVSVFVNPLQFGPAEDLSSYPRDLDADLQLCRSHRVDLVFAPDVATMYPDGEPQVRIDPGPLGSELEGASRPGHFSGVLTVVAKLIGLVGPDQAFFGAKDYQQLVLVRRCAADLCLPVAIAEVPTVRAPGGLALSSRNRYLSAAERDTAGALSAALRSGQAVGRQGPDAVLARAREALESAEEVEVDYLELRGPDLGVAPTRGPARLLVAARVGRTRLIDNIEVTLGTGDRV